MKGLSKYTEMRNKCIIKLNTGNGRCLYLKSLFPIQWSEFISEGELYSNEEEARSKLNGRHYQLSADLYEKELRETDIEIVSYLDGKLQSETKYIGG